MSKTKKKKKLTAAKREERAAEHRERAELAAKQNRRMFWLIAGIVICIALLTAFLVASFHMGTPNGYTYTQYQRLQTGMSYEQVTNLLGDDGTALTGSDGAVKTYVWTNEDGSNITVTFVDDAVSAFNQKGLSD